MPRTASFYSSARRSPTDAIRADLANDPRQALAFSLMQQDDRPAYGGPWEGVARAGQQALGAFLAAKLRKEGKGREESAHKAIAEALTKMQGDYLPPGVQGPVRSGDPRAAIASLLQNPDTAGLAFDLQSSQIEQRRAQEQAAAAHRRALELKAAPGPAVQPLPPDVLAQREQLAKADFDRQTRLRGIPQATAPVPGRDVPLPPEVYEQQLGLAMNRARATAAAKGPQFTPGQEAIDKAAGKDLAQFVASGGSADVQKNVAQLDRAIGELEKGGVTGTSVGLTPDAVLSATNPRAVDTQEMVAEVAQRNLRLILGAQFTQKEGERLIARAYNPYLDEKINKRRVTALKQSIMSAAKAKQEAWDYMQDHGTLKGFTGKLWTMQDFERAVDKAGSETSEKPNERGFKIERIE